LESLFDWGIDVVLWLQQFSPALDLPFKILTFLGNEEFYLLVMPLIYWCVDRRKGVNLFILLLLSAYLNAVAKVLVNQPRPFDYDPRVKALVHADGGGLPSGHTQNAVAIWGYWALRSQKQIWWWTAAFLLVAIPLSRMYLGVHFPTDLFGGYILGALLLFLFLKLAPEIETRLMRKGLAWQLAVALGLPLLLMFLSPAVDAAVLTSIATLMGVATGFVLERHWVRFGSPGPWQKKILRYLLGIVVLTGLWLGLRVAFAGLEPAALFRVIRYLVVGLWGGLGAPWVFVRLKLAQMES